MAPATGDGARERGHGRNTGDTRMGKNRSAQASESYKGFNPATLGASEVVPVEFWKPGAVRDTLIGRLEEIKENRVGSDVAHSALIRPAIVVTAGGDGQGYDSLRVGLNTVLKARITNANIGQYLAIMFTGTTPTPAGKMRTFKVFQLDAAKFAELVEQYAPGLTGDDAPGDDGAPVHDDDDLPF